MLDLALLTFNKPISYSIMELQRQAILVVQCFKQFVAIIKRWPLLESASSMNQLSHAMVRPQPVSFHVMYEL
jgi:hypothetical protein